MPKTLIRRKLKTHRLLVLIKRQKVVLVKDLEPVTTIEMHLLAATRKITLSLGKMVALFHCHLSSLLSQLLSWALGRTLDMVLLALTTTISSLRSLSVCKMISTEETLLTDLRLKIWFKTSLNKLKTSNSRWGALSPKPLILTWLEVEQLWTP